MNRWVQVKQDHIVFAIFGVLASSEVTFFAGQTNDVFTVSSFHLFSSAVLIYGVLSISDSPKA